MRYRRRSRGGALLRLLGEEARMEKNLEVGAGGEGK
jgi:hypothetical protein